MLPCEAQILPLHGQLHLSRQGDDDVVPNNTHMLTVSGNLLMFTFTH